MSDITSPTGVVGVQWQEEKASPDGEGSNRDVPANKVAETYEETARGISDSITILGIPAELMTTQVQATIGGMVSEIQFLKSKVKRYETSKNREQGTESGELSVGERLIRELETALSLAPPVGFTRELVLTVVNTFEDIRKSSGILAATSVIEDVASEMRASELDVNPVGLLGGPVIAALLTRPDVTVAPEAPEQGGGVTTADKVRGIVESKGYSVAGLDMKVSFTVASVRVEAGQSALQAIGQADHILKS